MKKFVIKISLAFVGIAISVYYLWSVRPCSGHIYYLLLLWAGRVWWIAPMI